jgi:hypothetical protein
MNKSESISALAKALAAAQGEMGAAAKSSRNPFFNSNYADLASVWDACRAPLAKHGLSVVQLIEPAEQSEAGVYETRAIIETVLAHESGEWISSRVSLPVLGPDLKGGGKGDVNAQSFGSAITYARRYALAAIVGVYQDDDDGNAASRTVAAEPAMDAAELSRALAAIMSAPDLGALKAAFTNAVRAAGRDQAAQKHLIAAKDSRKSALVSNDPKAPAVSDTEVLS